MIANMVTIRYGDDVVDLFYDPADRTSHLLIHARAVFAAQLPFLGLYREDGFLLPGLLEAHKHITPGDSLILRLPVEEAAA